MSVVHEVQRREQTGALLCYGEDTRGSGAGTTLGAPTPFGGTHMLIVRDVFTAKPGKASKLARLFKKVFGAEYQIRVMTDLVADYNTVVLEMTVANLSEFERHMEEYRTGKEKSTMDPKVAEEMSNYTELWVTGRREIFQVVD